MIHRCAILLAVWLSTAISAQAQTPSTRPNVIFLLADDLRSDCLSGLGHAQVKTPHLDALMKAGVYFSQATCANPLCVPSRAEILSGRTAFKNGFYTKSKLADKGPALWAEIMRLAGFSTFYVGKWHTSGRPSTRGYDEAVGLYGSGKRPDSPQYDHAGRKVTGYVGWVFQTDAGKRFYEKGVGLTPDISKDFADAAISVIERKHAKPFFLHVNFTAPHDPRFFPTGFKTMYRADDIKLPPNFMTEHPFDHGNLKGRDEVLLDYPRRPEEVRAELAAYYAVISHLDQQIGRILAALEKAGLAENTIVIFASDHGLAVGSHGLVGKQNMYAHTINVPLIFRGPGIPKNQRRQAGCYLRDLYPTVCEMVGTKAAKGIDGKSLAPVIKVTRESVHPFVTGYFSTKQRMIRKGNWKLILYPEAKREQLFNLASDPLEVRNLAAVAEHADRKRSMHRALYEWFREQGDPIGEKLAP